MVAYAELCRSRHRNCAKSIRGEPSMSILQSSTAFVMRELVKAALQTVGGGVGEVASQAVFSFLDQRFTNHSERLTLAFRKANDRAWRAVEISLEGDGWLVRIKGKLRPA